MNEPSTTRPQAERSDQSRARILAAAIKQFSENGLAGARTELIAEAAGVNKALLYYYFKNKDALYTAAVETVFELTRSASMAVLETSASAGERFLQIVLQNFDRSHTSPSVRALMQQEMIRLHRGEENRMAQMATLFFRPLWDKIDEVLKEGIVAGELIDVDPTQIRYASLGANVFYFLSAPLTRLAYGFDPMERGELERRRKSAMEYLGKTIFTDREHGARVAARLLASTPLPAINQNEADDTAGKIQSARSTKQGKERLMTSGKNGKL